MLEKMIKNIWSKEYLGIFLRLLKLLHFCGIPASKYFGLHIHLRCNCIHQRLLWVLNYVSDHLSEYLLRLRGFRRRVVHNFGLVQISLRFTIKLSLNVIARIIK